MALTVVYLKCPSVRNADTLIKPGLEPQYKRVFALGVIVSLSKIIYSQSAIFVESVVCSPRWVTYCILFVGSLWGAECPVDNI